MSDEVLAAAQRELARRQEENAAELAKRLANGPGGPRKGLAGVADCFNLGITTRPAALMLCKTDGCRARLFGKEREDGFCSSCANGGYRGERREHIRSRIPADFRWADLGNPLVSPDDVLVVPDAAREAAKTWLASEAPLLTIVGPKTGAGKTTLAAAVAMAAIDMGEEPVWIRANVLSPEHPNQEQAQQAFRAATTRRFVVIDGIGKELGGANAESGVVAQRQGWMTDIINGLHSLDNRRVVVTVDMAREPFERTYGADAVRRIVTRSKRVHVIALQRIAPVKPVDF